MRALFTDHRCNGFTAALCLALGLPGALFGQPEATVVEPPPLALQDALSRALAHNLSLEIERSGSALASDELVAAEADFDPVLFSEFTVSETGSAPAGGAGQSINSTQQMALGLRKSFNLGTEVTVETQVDRSTDNRAVAVLDPDYATSLGVTVRQPLLEGFGEPVNLARIARAHHRLRRSELELQRQTLDVLAETEIAYWTVAETRERVRLFESSVALARTLLEENRERVRVGLANPVSVLQAEALLAEREEAIILARLRAENALDALLALMGDLGLAETAEFTVAPLPQTQPAHPPMADTMRASVAFSLDRRIQQEVQAEAEIDRLLARDETEPQLDAFASASALGRDDFGAGAYGDALGRGGYRVRVGLSLELPLGERAANARLRSALRRLDRESLRQASIQQELLQQTRSAWRAVTSGKQRVAATGATLELNRQSFAQERGRYQAGVANFRDVLEAQRDLDNARFGHLQALAELQRAVVVLSRLDGRILSRHGFSWEPETALPDVPVSPVQATPLAQEGTPSLAKPPAPTEASTERPTRRARR